MWRVPPEGKRRRNTAVTCPVNSDTRSRMREEAAATFPSTARNALVMAISIFSSV